MDKFNIAPSCPPTNKNLATALVQWSLRLLHFAAGQIHSAASSWHARLPAEHMAEKASVEPDATLLSTDLCSKVNTSYHKLIIVNHQLSFLFGPKLFYTMCLQGDIPPPPILESNVKILFLTIGAPNLYFNN